jgi:hypothetical protein
MSDQENDHGNGATPPQEPPKLCPILTAASAIRPSPVAIAGANVAGSINPVSCTKRCAFFLALSAVDEKGVSYVAMEGCAFTIHAAQAAMQAGPLNQILQGLMLRTKMKPPFESIHGGREN